MKKKRISKAKNQTYHSKKRCDKRIGTQIDRKTIQKALEDGLIYVVSDGIQNDGAVEYALTQAGQEFYKNGIA